ncbi:hypothetical protein B0T22DRAFT_519027 [Podospora appendiculata]|uniref:Uncharacterized protein n=1 Tax=Podospora appendiculata TaxID=314037 RepID=A0AAE0X241_9PEZI|nr:hypothetical protein B0T22DRAFT_519027 [Podospora appendiculata]
MTLAQPRDITTINAAIKTTQVEGIILYEKGTGGHDRSVATLNWLYRFSRPEWVVQPIRTTEVRTVIEKAIAHGIRVLITNGCHSYKHRAIAELSTRFPAREPSSINGGEEEEGEMQIDSPSDVGTPSHSAAVAGPPFVGGEYVAADNGEEEGRREGEGRRFKRRRKGQVSGLEHGGDDLDWHGAGPGGPEDPTFVPPPPMERVGLYIPPV